MIKKVYWLFIIFIIMFTSGCFFNKKNIEGTDEDYTYENTYYVITKNVDSGKISYFEVNNKGNRRKTEKFESDTFDEIIYLHNCFDIKDNIIMNSCKLTNDFGEVSLDGINQKIVYQISLLEHSMFDVKIYKKNNDYYVVRDINVNIYEPYELYKYDINDNKLELICKISDEEIIGFKKKKNEDYYTNDELKAEFTGYANQYIIRSTYVFENDKAVACYMEIESDNELFLKQYDESLEKILDMSKIRCILSGVMTILNKREKEEQK